MDQIQELQDINFRQFDVIFPTEESAIDFLQRAGMIPSEEDFIDQPCGSFYKQRNGVIEICNRTLTVHSENSEDKNYKMGWGIRCRGRVKNRRKTGCGYRFSPLANTWFTQSHLKFKQIMMTTYVFVQKYPVELATAELKIDEKTIIDWYSFCREVCRHYNHQRRIGGPGLTVEIDECHIYTPKYHRGRGMRTQIWVVGGICKETGECFVVHASQRNRRKLHGIIREYVEPLSIVHTDSWAAYDGMCEPFDPLTGFGCSMGEHFKINHRHSFVDYLQVPHPDADPNNANDRRGAFVRVTTNHIERLWREVRKCIKSCRSYIDNDGQRGNHAYLYINEFIYRQNRLKRCPDVSAKYRQFLDDIMNLYPGCTAAELVENRNEKFRNNNPGRALPQAARAPAAPVLFPPVIGQVVVNPVFGPNDIVMSDDEDEEDVEGRANQLAEAYNADTDEYDLDN